MIARRCEGMYGAFEAIECVLTARNRNLERFVILIPANFTGSHVDLPIFDLHAFFPRENRPSAETPIARGFREIHASSSKRWLCGAGRPIAQVFIGGNHGCKSGGANRVSQRFDSDMS